jgi:vanillate/4-hydroxybenzoate decarboxylase subunit D
MVHFPRPSSLAVKQVREPVDGVCPQCQGTDVRRYPVTSEGGWFLTTRCQECLTQVVRERWNMFGPIEFLADQVEALR